MQKMTKKELIEFINLRYGDSDPATEILFSLIKKVVYSGDREFTLRLFEYISATMADMSRKDLSALLVSKTNASYVKTFLERKMFKEGVVTSENFDQFAQPQINNCQDIIDNVESRVGK